MKHSFRPNIELLEERLCMSSVKLVDRGSTLVITGDNRANTVIMADNTFHGVSAVVIDNKFYGLFDATKIAKVNVNLKGGDDNFRFHTATEGGADFPPGYFYGKQFKINMGAGHDMVNYDFAWANGIHSGFAADMGLDITAGSGNDTVFIRFGGVNANVHVKASLGSGNDVFDASVLGKVYDTASLTFDVRGDAGNDKIFASYLGRIDGDLDFFLDGGKNDDEIRSTITMPDQSIGAAKARVLGNAGNDRLDLSIGGFVPYFHSARLQNTGVLDEVFTQAGLALVDGLIDGGTGFDTYHKSSNVPQVNCELGV